MSLISSSFIPIIILFIVSYGVFKKVKVYEVFVEGAKDGLKICKNIFPYLLCMLLAIKVFRESGILEYIINFIEPFTNVLGVPKEVITQIFIKPLSGSGALGIFTDNMKNFGPDSFLGVLSSVLMGSTETIFYTIALYFGAVKIKKIRHTLWTAILSEIIGVILAINITKIIFFN
ncbi:spore maturation protein [Candidatus Arthromitus sp. SFB-turkey]|uniref:spore maturation protein n=1 Tax=Candidatus Arthromitus sp. SFB-turkey TaxID=1840217 RepID=UPI0007F3DFF4|nr:spore maturation protein [Candidatus Arthromitus sp. SFB-turkey]OAT87495.1 spore maturation protein [Candidatus Arthromitus sp. SFB-turkey]